MVNRSKYQLKDGNFINSLSGKVAGVQIKQSNNLGGSTNVVIRGNASITGSNQALFVIDGVPVNNRTGNEIKLPKRWPLRL